MSRRFGISLEKRDVERNFSINDRTDSSTNNTLRKQNDKINFSKESLEIFESLFADDFK